MKKKQAIALRTGVAANGLAIRRDFGKGVRFGDFLPVPTKGKGYKEVDEFMNEFMKIKNNNMKKKTKLDPLEISMAKYVINQTPKDLLSGETGTKGWEKIKRRRESVANWLSARNRGMPKKNLVPISLEKSSPMKKHRTTLRPRRPIKQLTAEERAVKNSTDYGAAFYDAMTEATDRSTEQIKGMRKRKTKKKAKKMKDCEPGDMYKAYQAKRK